MMRIWKTISFIAWRDSGLNKSSKAWQSRASLITKSSQKASSASTLFTHNSKGHETSFRPERLHGVLPESGRHPASAKRFLGAFSPTVIFRWLVPSLPSEAKEVVFPHADIGRRR